MVDPSEDITGGFVRYLGEPLSCGYSAVAEAGNGRVYAVPKKEGRVIEIDPISGMMRPIGQPIWSWTPNPGDSSYIALLLADNGRLYAPPFREDRVLEIDPQAGTVRNIGFNARETQALLSPRERGVCGLYKGIAAAPNGRLYCAPYNASCVLEVDPQSGWTSYIGGPFVGHRFDESGGWGLYETIVCASNGNLYTARRWGGELHVLEINPVTRALRMIIPHVLQIQEQLREYLGCLTLASNGNLYSVGRTRVWEVDPNAGTMQQFGDTFDEALGRDSEWSYRDEKGILHETSIGKLHGFLHCFGRESPSVQKLTLCLSAGTLTVQRFGQDGMRFVMDRIDFASIGVNGRLISESRSHNRITEIDPQNGSFTFIGEALPRYGFCGPMIRLRSGRIISVPTYNPLHGDSDSESVSYRNELVPRCVLLIDYHALPLGRSDFFHALRMDLSIGKHTDVTIKTQAGKPYRAHKLVLSMQSSVFESMLSADMRETRDALVELGDDVSPAVAEMFMKYVYRDGTELLPRTWKEVMHLAALAHRYEMPDLVSSCAALLQATLRVNSAATLLGFSDRLQLTELKQATLDFIIANDNVLNTDEWEDVSASLLREVAAAMRGMRSRQRRPVDYEFPSETAWESLSLPRLRRACAERGLPQDGQRAELLVWLQTS